MNVKTEKYVLMAVTAIISAVAGGGSGYLGKDIKDDLQSKEVVHHYMREFLRGSEVKLFVNEKFEEKRIIAQEEDKKRKKLSEKFSEKMGVDVDEVHIEEGKMYKHYKRARRDRDSIYNELSNKIESYHRINIMNEL